MSPDPVLCGHTDCGHPMPCHRRYYTTHYCTRCRIEPGGGAGSHQFVRASTGPTQRLDRVLGWIAVDEEAGR